MSRLRLAQANPSRQSIVPRRASCRAGRPSHPIWSSDLPESNPPLLQYRQRKLPPTREQSAASYPACLRHGRGRTLPFLRTPVALSMWCAAVGWTIKAAQAEAPNGCGATLRRRNRNSTLASHEVRQGWARRKTNATCPLPCFLSGLVSIYSFATTPSRKASFGRGWPADLPLSPSPKPPNIATVICRQGQSLGLACWRLLGLLCQAANPFFEDERPC